MILEYRSIALNRVFGIPKSILQIFFSVHYIPDENFPLHIFSFAILSHYAWVSAINIDADNGKNYCLRFMTSNDNNRSI